MALSTESPNQPGAVFVNYRREDSKEVTSRLHDDLEYVLGPQSVFMDVSDIPPGSAFPPFIEDKLRNCRVVLVVIGRDWLRVKDPETHQRRLDTRHDWVRLEIEQALNLKKVILPVLVREARPLTERQLPTEIADLHALQAIPLSSERWRQDLQELLEALTANGLSPQRGLADKPTRPEPSMLRVIDYFYRRVGEAASTERPPLQSEGQQVECSGLRDLWQLFEYHVLQEEGVESAPRIKVPGQLSPYAPLLFGHPRHMRRLHLELRQGAVQLIEDFGLEFGELLNGLLSYSAGQMVIRPYFRTRYVYLGLYESIVRNSVPVLVEKKYFQTRLAPLFRQFNSLEVTVHGVLGEIPNYAADALRELGITERLESILGTDTLRRLGQPNYALFVEGDDESFVKVPSASKKLSLSTRYLDGDVWVANSANSLITRFIDISWREDMLRAINEIQTEVSESAQGRGIISSFDSHIVAVDDRLPDRVLAAEQMPVK